MKTELAAFYASRKYQDVPINDRLEAWEYAAHHVNDDFDLDDFRNDLDGRRILGEIHAAKLMNKPQTARLEKADEAFETHTVPTAECIWGEAEAKKNGWTPSTHPFYFRKPR